MSRASPLRVPLAPIAVTAWLLVSLCHCGAPQPAPPPPPPATVEGPPPVTAPPPPVAAPVDAPTPTEASRWLAVRAERLGLDLATAQARDEAMAAGPSDDGLWWDPQLATEVHGVWARLCKECHQGSRKLEKVLKYRPPPRAWARTETRFFTWDHEPRVAFKIMLAGAKAQPGEKDMPPWEGTLSNEQIWGLVYFVNQVSMSKKSDLH